MKDSKFEPFEQVLVRDRLVGFMLYDKGIKMTKDSANRYWKTNRFSHYVNDVHAYACIVGIWRECIPYKGNEHLLGTTNAPEESEHFEEA